MMCDTCPPRSGEECEPCMHLTRRPWSSTISNIRFTSLFNGKWIQSSSHNSVMDLLLRRHFKVHAAENMESGDLNKNSNPEGQGGGEQTEGVQERRSFSPSVYSIELEMLARAYIQQETGADRVRRIFKKDHMGRSSPEMEYIQVALVQTFVLSFFMKYVPEWRMAKKDFIREHHGTVFRTRIEAVRRMQDQISLRAGWEAGKFGTKITAFGASFVFLSQMIASYRNKTSVLEYTVAAGITGGLSRLQMGIKGFIAGSFLGGLLGTLVGGLAYGILRARNATQEERHIHGIMELLEVEKSIEGEQEFRKKLQKLREQQTTEPLPAS